MRGRNVPFESSHCNRAENNGLKTKEVDLD